MTTSARAVFLSYASQDAEAARRMADALRAFGVEVWFDQNELRGGDAWDAQIRRQIHACALFLPVISATTQQRGEGYFRREWHLAVERRNDMADNLPFIVPLVIDATRSAEAVVPEAFLRVQWTRLPGGVPSAQFVEQIKRLVESPRQLATVRAELTRLAVPESRRRLGHRVRWVAWLAGVAIVLAGVMSFMLLRNTEKNPGADLVPAQPASTSRDKSIVVLPFANISEEKHDGGFFADGMHEDIITNLALIRDLRVTSRTTAVTYRDSAKPIRQIGDELRVAYVLEGSVRRAGNRVRVTGQLIDARTDEHVWAKAYDRDVSDIFGIQAELAQAIATALQATLSPQEKALIERRPTSNLAAYDLLVQARDLHHRSVNSPTNLEHAAILAKQAVELDPAFAAAWAELASIHAVIFGIQGRDAAHRDGASAALREAERLAPEDPETLLARADYSHYVSRDLNHAAGCLQQLLHRQPNNADMALSLGLVLRRQGRWVESVTAMRRAVELDGRNPRNLRNLAQSLAAGRHFAEAVELQRRVVDLEANVWVSRLGLASYRLRAGDTRDADAASFDTAPVPVRIRAAFARGDFAEVIRLDVLLEESGRNDVAFEVGASLLGLGQVDEARARVLPALAESADRLATSQENAQRWMATAEFLAIAGRPEEAMAHGHKAVSLDPESRFDLYLREAQLAWIRAWSGDPEAALADYARLLRVPSYVHVRRLRTMALPATLRDDPRFRALLDDPTNDAPLF